MKGFLKTGEYLTIVPICRQGMEVIGDTIEISICLSLREKYGTVMIDRVALKFSWMMRLLKRYRVSLFTTLRNTFRRERTN